MAYKLKEHYNAWMRKYRANNKEKIKLQSKNWESRSVSMNSFKTWKARLKREYDITPDEYFRRCEEQENKCLICQRVPRRLNIDHDHQTGKVRGLLCPPCNIFLGYIEYPGWLDKALTYLKRE